MHSAAYSRLGSSRSAGYHEQCCCELSWCVFQLTDSHLCWAGTEEQSCRVTGEGRAQLWQTLPSHLPKRLHLCTSHQHHVNVWKNVEESQHWHFPSFSFLPFPRVCRGIALRFHLHFPDDLMLREAEHLFVCLLVTWVPFFNQVFLQVFCPFFCWIFCLILIELWKFFMFSRSKSIVGCMYVSIFPIHSLTSVF